jgi:hypothetical protein
MDENDGCNVHSQQPVKITALPKRSVKTGADSIQIPHGFRGG